MQRFLSELQRRQVLRVASAYLVGAWILLQVALAIQSALTLPASYSAAIFALLAIGFPVALVLSWFFEIAPDGIKRTAPLSGEPAPFKPETTDLILAGALVLVLGAGAVQLLMLTAPPAVPAPVAAAPKANGADEKAQAPSLLPYPAYLGDKSIAVLPFANLSPDKANEYFADGLAEELLNLLVKTGGLKVISRTSSFSFKGKDLPLPEIAKRLGVRHVLEGSVRMQGDDLRLTAQLIDVKTDAHLWSETYERKVENVFDLQAEIAREIVGALKVEVALSERDRKVPTKSIDAYRHYLKARSLHARRGPNDLEAGIALYKQAIALDPDFAEAHAGLATNYAVLGSTPGRDSRPLALESAKTALVLDPALPRAYGVIGTLARQELDWERAISNFEKALSLDPSDAVSMSSLASALSMLGDFDQAKRLRHAAIQIDPIYGALVTPALILDALASHDDKMVKELANRERMGSDQRRGVALLALTVLARERGDIAEFERLFGIAAKEYALPADFAVVMLRAAKTDAAFADAAKAIEARLAKNPKADAAPLFFIIGDYDRFFNVLDARIAQGATSEFWTSLALAWRGAPVNAETRQRFKTIARKIGLVKYWKAHGWPDRCKPKGNDDFECE